MVGRSFGLCFQYYYPKTNTLATLNWEILQVGSGVVRQDSGVVRQGSCRPGGQGSSLPD
jgi:hypothetical protein